MYIDMHSHSVASDDSRASVEQYLKWIGAQRKKGFRVDGIVLTEHRQFNSGADYSDLMREHNVLILKGSELDTRYGHFLVYGMNETIATSINLKDVTMDSFRLMSEARSNGAIAIPAHPGRHGIGLAEWMEQGVEFPGVHIVERFNAGNRPEEQDRANKLAEEKGYLGIGGSDAHFVSGIAKGMTWFPDGIGDEKDLVDALLEGNFRPVWLEETIETE